jgi:hypothetical protein
VSPEIQVGTIYVATYNSGNPADSAEQVEWGKVVHYRHLHKGVPIVGDELSAIVIGDEVVKLRTCWHKVSARPRQRATVDMTQALPAALADLATRVSRQSSKQPRCTRAGIIYRKTLEAGMGSVLFVPSCVFRIEKDTRVVVRCVDGLTGAVVDPSRFVWEPAPAPRPPDD